jgi:hypothetical protein
MSLTASTPDFRRRLADPSPKAEVTTAGAPPGAEMGLTKIEKSITEIVAPQNNAPAAALGRRRPGRPPRQTEAPVTWSVRGVSRETRSILEQAASRAGKTMGQYLNEDIRALAEQQLTAAPEPVLQEQIRYLQHLVENLTAMLTPLAQPLAVGPDAAAPARLPLPPIR